MTAPVRTVSCPRCGAPVAWTAESRWRPFCSERCKTIDLGAWATERYKLPARDDPNADDDATQVPD